MNQGEARPAARGLKRTRVEWFHPGTVAPGPWPLVRGARHPALGPRPLVRGARPLALGTRPSAPGARHQALGPGARPLVRGATRSHPALVRGARILALDLGREIKGLRHPAPAFRPRGRNLRWPWLGFIEIIRWKTIPIHGYKNRSGRSPAMFHVKQNHRFPNAENRDTRSC